MFGKLELCHEITKPKVMLALRAPQQRLRRHPDTITLRNVSVKKALLYHGLHLTASYLVWAAVLWLAVIKLQATPNTAQISVKSRTKPHNLCGDVEQSDSPANALRPALVDLQRCGRSHCCCAMSPRSLANFSMWGFFFFTSHRQTNVASVSLSPRRENVMESFALG